MEGAAVSFRLPEEGPGGTFSRGMRTDIAITTPDGKAAVYGMNTGRMAGPFQVRVTVVKGPVRAGVVVDQYISDAPVKELSARSPGPRPWLWIAAVAAGGAAAGFTFRALKRPGATGSVGGPPPAAITASAPPQIGAPVISIGGPR